MVNGVIYARYSCDKQTENSILGQVRECREFAKSHAINVIEIYKDEAISGRSATKRPGFMKMIKDASLGLFQCVIVWKGDRFARNRADSAKYKTELKRLGVRVLSVTEPNLVGAQAILMDGINEAFAEYYSVELAEKVGRGMEQNALDGRWNGGSMTFGYALGPDHRMVIKEDEAEVVRYIYSEYGKGALCMKELGKKLREEGILNHNGKPFGKTSLKRLLTNRRYIGEYEFRGKVNKNGFPPIVDEMAFRKAQDVLARLGGQGGRFKAKERFLLSGKLICGECLGKMRSTSGTGHNGVHKYYRCRGGIGHPPISYKKEWVEGLVMDEVYRMLRECLDVRKVCRMVMESRSLMQPESGRLSKEVDEIEQKIARYNLALESGVALEETISRMKELQGLLREKKEELTRAKEAEGFYDEEEILRALERIKSSGIETEESKGYLVNNFVDSIYLYPSGLLQVVFNITKGEAPIMRESFIGEMGQPWKRGLGKVEGYGFSLLGQIDMNKRAIAR